DYYCAIWHSSAVF
nr:immunoglobulin light chain junction region [Macaca mulatta]MOW16963.1 immunoglobulin light chain junction region [Macaca mulatta]